MEKKSAKPYKLQLTRLDLVSREEFDVQTQVCYGLVKNWRYLEQRISELEARNNPAAEPISSGYPAS